MFPEPVFPWLLSAPPVGPLVNQINQYCNSNKYIYIQVATPLAAAPPFTTQIQQAQQAQPTAADGQQNQQAASTRQQPSR